MSLPSIVAFPEQDVRQAITSDQWNEYLTSLDVIVQAHIDAVENAKPIDKTSLTIFLISFHHQLAIGNVRDSLLKSSRLAALRPKIFSLVEICIDKRINIEPFSQLPYLISLAKAHPASEQLSILLESRWEDANLYFQRSSEVWRKATTTTLESATPEKALQSLNNIAPLMRKCQNLAAYVLIGTDFLDACNSAYASTKDASLREAIVVVTYLGFRSLAAGKQANTNALTDLLFGLKATADSSPASQSLLAELITATPLLTRLRTAEAVLRHDRMTKLLDSLVKYEKPGHSRHDQHPKRRQAKGKAKQNDANEHLHIHKLSLLSQIQDLFPDLGPGFIMKLLNEYGDDSEVVIAHLLEDSLPEHLQSLDRHENAPVFSSDTRQVVDDLVPKASPEVKAFVPQRANAFDDDDLDRLEVDATRLHIGKRENVSSDSAPPNKAAIMAALAAFDADDDERDDTYDAEDVGGTIDAAHHDGDDGASFDDVDVKLYTLYIATPDIFGRTSAIRRSQQRASLKQQTGMTDEAIEGWAIMLQRNPRRVTKLEQEVVRFAGRQSAIPRTAYRAGLDESESGDADGNGQSSRGGFNHGRGRGMHRDGQGRRNMEGSSRDVDSAAAQRRKEAHKSRRANHNRRNQRARKMARGGPAGAA